MQTIPDSVLEKIRTHRPQLGRIIENLKAFPARAVQFEKATAASRTSTGSPRGRLPTCILVEALDTFTRSMPAGSFTRPAGRSAAVRSRDQLDRLTTWPATDRPRVQTGYQGDGREQDLDRLPRGRLPTCILVEALDTFTRSMPAGSFTQPGCRSARTRTRATRPRGRTSTRSHVAVCRRASWSRPWTRSPGRCRRGASRGRVADRCGPGPGRHGRGQDLDTLPRGRLPTCILVEALDTLP